MSIFSTPSFYPHIINAILILTALVILMKNSGEISSMNTYSVISITLLFAIAIGIHGLSHMGFEIFYRFNPMRDILDNENNQDK